MPLKIVPSNKFKKDIELAKKRGFDMALLDTVVTKLANQEKLEPKYKDHQLTGSLYDFRECHIKPDWLLIYSIDGDELELFLFRTGTHSDLFV